MKFDKIDAAVEARHDAGRQIIEITREEIPVGSIVKIDGCKSQLIIYSHSNAYWCDPGYLFATNESTGKSRRIHYSRIVEIIRKGGR